MDISDLLVIAALRSVNPGVLPERSSRPKVVFPKNLLLTANITSVTAYLTVPQRPLVRDCSGCTPGLLSSRSGDWIAGEAA